jgi:C4-dicarboxylate-specific signal transduction histidine kinase
MRLENNSRQLGWMVGMKLVLSRAKRRWPQFSLRFLLSAFTLLVLAGASVAWIRVAGQRLMAERQRDYAQQMRYNLDRLMILRMAEGSEQALNSIPDTHKPSISPSAR